MPKSLSYSVAGPELTGGLSMLGWPLTALVVSGQYIVQISWSVFRFPAFKDDDTFMDSHPIDTCYECVSTDMGRVWVNYSRQMNPLGTDDVK